MSPREDKKEKRSVEGTRPTERTTMNERTRNTQYDYRMALTMFERTIRPHLTPAKSNPPQFLLLLSPRANETAAAASSSQSKKPKMQKSSKNNNRRVPRQPSRRLSATSRPFVSKVQNEKSKSSTTEESLPSPCEGLNFCELFLFLPLA